MNIKLYSKTNCPTCVKAKSLLSMKNLPYTEYHLWEKDNPPDGNYYTREMFFSLFPNARTVPQIVIDDVSIGSYEQLKEYLESDT